MPREAGLRSVPSSAHSLVRIAACADTPQHRARLNDAFRGNAVLGFADSLTALGVMLRARIGDVGAVILPARDRDQSFAGPLVRQIVLDRPRVAIVAYLEPDAEHSTDIRDLAIAGVHQFFFRGIDDRGVACRSILALAQRQCSAGWVMQQLAPIFPPGLHPLVEAALTRPDAITSVVELANALGVHRKTLFNRCDHAGSLPPAELLAWCRLVLVAYHLENTGCTIGTIGLQLGYPSDTALRNAMKRYTGLRAGEIRELGGVAHVINSLRRRLREWGNGRRVAPGVTLRIAHQP